MTQHIPIQKILTGVLILLLLAAFLIGPAAADTSDTAGSGLKHVKVGCFEVYGAGVPEKPGGYAVDYVQTLAPYAGWDVEYVPGTGSGLVDLAASGEIDILPMVSRSAERENVFLFPDNPIGEAGLCLFTAADRHDIVAGDLSTINGKTVGVTRGQTTARLETWAAQQGITLKYKECEPGADRGDLLHEGVIDVSYGPAYEIEEGVIPAFSLGQTVFNIGFAKTRSDLLADYNAALAELNRITPDLIPDLQKKYFNGHIIETSLSDRELAWLEEHGNTIKVGGFISDPNNAYYYEDEKGVMTGFIPALLSGMMSRMGVDADIEYVYCPSVPDAVEAMKSGDIDLFFPFYHDQEAASAEGVLLSNVVRTTPMSVVYKPETPADEIMNKIATPFGRLGKMYMEDSYPASGLVDASSVENAVELVISGEATGAVAYTDYMNELLRVRTDMESNVLYKGCDLCFAALPSAASLITLVNKGLNTYTAGEINSMMTEYSRSQEITFTDYLKAHPAITWLVASVLVLFVALIIILSFYNTKINISREEERRARIAEKEMEEAGRLSKQVIANFVKKYSLVFKVHLADDTFEVLKDQENVRIADTEFTKFSELMAFLREKLVFEADREMLAREADYDRVRTRLAAENEYSVEYRVLDGDDTVWELMQVDALDENTGIVGFSRQNTEILLRRLAERDKENYFALFAVDLDADCITVLKNEGEYKTIAVGKSAPFREWMLKLAALHEGEPRAFYESAADIDLLRKRFTKEDMSSYSYSYFSATGPKWITTVAYVLARHENGVPAVLSFGLMYSDALAADRQRLEAELKTALAKAYEETHRNDMLNEVFESKKWSYEIDAEDRVLSVRLSKVNDSFDQHIDAYSDKWIEMLHPDEREETLKAFYAAIRDHSCETSYDVMYRMHDLSGNWHWIHSIGKMMRRADGTGEFFGFVVNIEKDLERKAALDRLSAISGYLMSSFASVYYCGFEEGITVVHLADEVKQAYTDLGLLDVSVLPAKIPGVSDKPGRGADFPLLHHRIADIYGCSCRPGKAGCPGSGIVQRQTGNNYTCSGLCSDRQYRFALHGSVWCADERIPAGQRRRDALPRPAYGAFT